MKKISLTLATLAVAASAFAQTPAQPQAPAPATTAAAAASAPSAEQRAARHEARVEQRIKYLHDQLKITSAQEPQWKTFADTMRDNGETMGRLYRDRMAKHDVSALDDMKQYAELSQANADGAKKLSDAFAPLYASFPAEQKALADTTFRSWLNHGGEHRGKGKTKAKEGKAAAAPAASAPAQP
ncbi:Spy/CpxP family protein refolding chaperone [Burkholderia pyrrocinia]|uniref:Spy/CpxP family protein refolding chaperone n=1 Tax=Burkholderia TaxID=32008 RepID=UPI001C304672|nr:MULTISPECIES: Spy/CpxP family protein refolding chaperone [Burkholderia]EKS9884875.1 Spy/CpxP family protein refolding chaperone [Burkholderia pyrrocinia]EKS9893013.1 Spy/CpxP family protein refolding chaperone [Burkholderia pyrrocinia]EKS9905521.1 Spy/CpxP family protein refolding chaperone [Burkholderia pyrrocinia]UOB54093.1 Spy/CpxP family protein refolding chaperone [Burkholderia pyrrocinia]